MNQIVKKEEAGAVVQMDVSASVMEIISRAASDPSVDVDKMERLLAMAERMKDREAKAAFNAALADLQPKLPIITERGEIKNNQGKVQSKYALWEDVIEAIRDLLSEHGFALSFRTGRENDQITVTGILSHRMGHSEETTIFLPLDVSGAKNAVQGVGSSTSYGKRYAAQALLNLTSRGEDDDGQKAGAKTITDDQKTELVNLMKETGADTVRFLAFLKVKSLDELPANQFGRAKQALEAKRKKA